MYLDSICYVERPTKLGKFSTRRKNQLSSQNSAAVSKERSCFKELFTLGSPITLVEHRPRRNFKRST